MMVIFVDQHKEQYGVEPICKQIQIAPSNYYEHKVRERDPDRLPDRIKRERSLKATYSVYGRIISKFMAPTKSGGSCYEKVLLLLAAPLSGC